MQVSLVNYSNLNKEFRIDAEYYRKEILDTITLLEKKQSDNLDNLVDFIIGPFGSTITVDKYVEQSDFRYVRNKDINDFLIKDDDPAFISEKDYNSLPRFHIKEKDLLITVVGTLGKVAIAQKKDTNSIFSCKSTILRCKKINPYYLLAYLNSRIGRLLSLRGKRGAIQEGLNLLDLKEIKVFLPENKFQKLIETIILQAFKLTLNANYCFNQSQYFLLSQLGLESWKPKHKLSYVRNFSNVKSSGRLDAEYFQPKYDEIIETIKKYKGGWDIISNQFKLNKSTFKKIEGKKYNYLEISGVNVSNGEIYPIELDFSELPANAKIKLKKGDLVISKVRTYRGAVAIIERDDLIGSSAFTVLQEKGSISKETLFTLLKSLPYLQYSLKFNTGTSYPTITDGDILKYPIPLFDEKIQTQIKEKIVEATEFRQKSKTLLEIAKRGVEVAIENDEATAEKWIKDEVAKLGVKLEA